MALSPEVIASLQHNDIVATRTAQITKQLVIGSGKLKTGTGSATLAKAMRLPFTRSLHWLESTLAKTIGYETADLMELVLRNKDKVEGAKPVARSQRKFLSSNATGAFIAPLYAAPGCVTGFCTLSGTFEHPDCRVHDFPFKGNPVSPGILGMGSLLASNKPVIAVASYRAAINLHFRWTMASSVPCPFVGLSDQLSHPTRDLDLLMFRPLTFWAPILTGQILYYAANADGRLAIVGPKSSDSLAISAWLQNAEPKAIEKQINATALPWYECVAAKATSLSEDELLDLVTAARLTQSQINRIVDVMGPSQRQKLESVLKNRWNHQVIQTGYGYIEQRETGWYLQNNGRETQIIDSPFRVTRAIHDGQSIRYRVEVKHRGRIHTLELDRDEFTNRPLHTMQTAMLDRGIGMFNYEPSWDRRGLHIAMQFHSPELIRPLDVGHDAQENCLRANQVEVSLLDGRITAIDSPTNGRWLPFADAASPSRQELKTLNLQSVDRDAVIAWVANHLWNARPQGKAYTVAVDPSIAVRVRAVISQLETMRIGTIDSLQSNSANADQLQYAVSGSGHWVSADGVATAWLGMQKPVVRLEGEQTQSLTVQSAVLQRAALQLLSRSIRTRHSLEDMYSNVRLAWHRWMVEQHLIEQIPVDLPVYRPMDAAVKLIEFGLSSQALTVEKLSRGVEDNCISFDAKDQVFVLTTRTLNLLFKSQGYRSVALDEYVRTLYTDERLAGQVVRRHKPCLRIYASAFNLAVRELVRDGCRRQRTA